MPAFIDLSGQRCGRLLIKRRVPNERPGRVVWECECDCGAEVTVSSNHLRRKAVLSCGCHRREMNMTHGLDVGGEHPLRSVWRNMKARCANSNSASFELYGGRGIKVCEQWLNNFAAFVADVGPRPSSTHSLDRIDNDGNYEPGNVRWATQSEQMLNRDRWNTQRLASHNTSGYRGVAPQTNGRWQARMKSGGVLRQRTFATLDEALICRIQFEFDTWGQPCPSNVPHAKRLGMA